MNRRCEERLGLSRACPDTGLFSGAQALLAQLSQETNCKLSARKPLFLDESAHDWEFVRLGRRLGWSGVALKTCKPQTGALLRLCSAKAQGMPLMVQDLTNPMLAITPHGRLATHACTIQGVECNAMQSYPEAFTARGTHPPRPLPPPRRLGRPLQPRLRLPPRRNTQRPAPGTWMKAGHKR